MSDNVVQLEGGLENTSGFHTFRMDGETELGDWSDFTTIYRVLEGAVQYSDNGSVYVEPVPEHEPDIEPMPDIDPVPSLEERVSELEEKNLELTETIDSILTDVIPAMFGGDL
ncbi:MAG: hypothetical protein KBS66_07440 [Eubacterium sp.]|nr:hypothetical protein [Candidatus Colimonas fimequi]